MPGITQIKTTKIPKSSECLTPNNGAKCPVCGLPTRASVNGIKSKNFCSRCCISFGETLISRIINSINSSKIEVQKLSESKSRNEYQRVEEYYDDIHFNSGSKVTLIEPINNQATENPKSDLDTRAPNKNTLASGFELRCCSDGIEIRLAFQGQARVRRLITKLLNEISFVCREFYRGILRPGSVAAIKIGDAWLSRFGKTIDLRLKELSRRSIK